GFRRLAVIDLETGQQPIVLRDRRLAIVLNGEIYNFRELRRELEVKGRRFRSRGDAEVVLGLYAEEGIDCLKRLNGMFSLALWDGVRQTLFLARDRFGIKPLYLCREKGTLAFASEIRALRAGGFPSRPRIDPVQLRHFLGFGYLAPEGAPLLGVRSLPPASVLEVDAGGGEQLRRYWEPPGPGDAPGTAAAAGRELRARLDDAVERQLVADVPVGVFLSGGLDSSTLSALSRSFVSGPLRTFSVGFEGPGSVSELGAAREVAEFLGSEHHELMMDPKMVAADLDAILGGLDAPLADPTAIPTWYMSRLARERVTVALSGEGADEIFGGYARQRYDVAIDRIGGFGRRLLPAVLRLAGRRPSPQLRQRLRMAPGLQRQLDWGRVFSASEIDTMMAEPLASEGALMEARADLAERWQVLAASDPVNGRLAADRETFLPGDLLPKVDRMSMAHSLEVRVPFLDNAVVDFVLALPGRLKQSLRRDKIILRQVARDLVTRTAATRRKRGFDVPIGPWLRGPLRPAMLAYLSPEVVGRQGLLRPAAVEEMVAAHLDGKHDRGRRLWTLLVLSHWLETGGAA
ncbi:MAG: asparagine synthase (glutamine-hydrolyzing), partial [Thermoanaerobaculales bacterium]